MAAFTDGCQPDLGPPKNHGTCLHDATRLSGLNPQIQGPAVALQTCGKGLYARYDRLMQACPQSVPAPPGQPGHHRTHRRHHHKRKHHSRPPRRSRGFTG